MMACSCSKNDNQEPEPEPEPISGFYFGADLSYVNQIEDKGGVYKENNTQVDPYATFKKHGVNLVRLRLWNNPSWIKDIYGSSSVLYSGYEDVEKSIQRAKNAGMEVLLDFHYSDTWADPGKQKVPELWKNITDIEVLCDSVYKYTYKILNLLLAKNLLPQMVQIGNETNCGMMITDTNTGFPNLNVCNGNWVNMGKVLNAAIDAVKKIDSETGSNIKIVLHVADPKNLDWWMGDVINKGKVTRFDIMGFSYYHIWHTTVKFDDLTTTIKKFEIKVQQRPDGAGNGLPFYQCQ
jgi:arabinogalactan endo-1,4-beta-galactosidase